MEASRQKPRIDIHREQGQGDNPNPVLHDEQRDRRQCQDTFRPGGPEEEVAGEETRDQQDQTRANPAAFFGDLDGDARQRKGEPRSKNGNAHELEQHAGDFRGSRLQPEDRSAQDGVGDGNHQKQEQHRKEAPPERLSAVAQHEARDPRHHHRTHRDRELVVRARPGQVSSAEPVDQRAAREQPKAQPPTRLGMGEDPLASQKEERSADQRYQDDVGVVLVLERKSGQHAQRRPKGHQGHRDEGGEADRSLGEHFVARLRSRSWPRCPCSVL